MYNKKSVLLKRTMGCKKMEYESYLEESVFKGGDETQQKRILPLKKMSFLKTGESMILMK